MIDDIKGEEGGTAEEGDGKSGLWASVDGDNGDDEDVLGKDGRGDREVELLKFLGGEGGRERRCMSGRQGQELDEENKLSFGDGFVFRKDLLKE